MFYMRYLTSVLFLFLGILPLVSFGQEVHTIKAIGDLPFSNQFQVRVNGQVATVEKLEKFDVPIHYTRIAYGGDKPVTIEIEINNPIEYYSISPKRKQLKGLVKDHILSFSLDGPTYLLVKINRMEELFILVDKMQDYKSDTFTGSLTDIMDYQVDNTGKSIETAKLQKAIDDVSRMNGVLYFPAGIYKTGELKMRSNMSVILSEGALLLGSEDVKDYADKSLIRLDNVSNFRLLGYGVIDGSGWSGLRNNGGTGFHLLYASDCNDILIDGVMLRDPSFWNTRVYRSKNFHLKNIKIFNNRPYKNWTNTDGIDFDSSVDCSVTHAVIHAGDDNLVVKGLDKERLFISENILFDDVLTVGNSAATKIGTETGVEYFKNITFRNIDVVKCKRALVINAYDSTYVENVKFENIFVEEFDFNGTESPRLIDFEITDKSWRGCVGNCTINNVRINNVHVGCGLQQVTSQILGKNQEFGVDGVYIQFLNSENLVIRDLEISNKGDVPKAGLLGLWVELDKFGESHNMVIDDLYVHDVYGSTVIEKGGGIGICIQNGRDNDSILNRFIGMTIENCYLKDCQRDGIKFRGYWSRKQWNPNLGVVVRKNVLDGVPGDGIVLAGCDGGLIEYNVMKNCPKTLPESEACDGIWPWCSDNTLVQFNVVSDHRSIIDGYAYDSDWGCRNSIFQYNLSYNNDGGFMLVIGTNGWPEDWCVNGNIETKVRYNVSINDGLRNYLTNASHKDAYFSPVMHFTGYTQNTLVENNLFYLFPKPEPQIDRTLFHFTKHDSSYGKGDVFKNNYIYAPEVIVAVKEEKAVGNQYFGNVYIGSLKTPATGFTKQEGTFNKSLWYNTEDKNWDILLDFLKDKTVPVNGKELKVLDIIGAN